MSPAIPMTSYHSISSLCSPEWSVVPVQLAHGDSVANRVAARPQPLRKTLAYDRHRGRVEVVSGEERSPLFDRNAHRLKVPGADDLEVHERVLRDLIG